MKKQTCAISRRWAAGLSVALLALSFAITPVVVGAADPLHGDGITITALRGQRFEVTFELPADDSIESAAIAGGFNAWDPRELPLTMHEIDGVWRGTTEIVAGEYTYKYVVNGGDWRRDERNPLTSDDGHGALNSELRLGIKARIRESRAKVGDNRVQSDALVHLADSPLYFRPLQGGRVLLRLVTLANDAKTVELLRPTATTVDVESVDPSELTWAAYPMEKQLSDSRFDYWESVIVPDTGDAVVYAFKVTDGTAGAIVDSEGAMANATAPRRPFFRRYNSGDVFSAPDWARGVVWYQIMPDRWRNGSTENDPKDMREWTSRWKEPSPSEVASGQSFYNYYVYDRVYGGDLQGIIDQLPYLNKIGITGIYLNPIWASFSPHGYDVVDYRHVEDRLGAPTRRHDPRPNEDLLDASTWGMTESDKLFLKLLTEAKKRGLRVVVDAVLNHSGNEHPAFKEVAEKGRDSAYRDWYDVSSWEPFEYEGWGGFGKMPVFREDRYGFVDSSLRQHLFDVTTRWMDPNGDGDPSDGVDGWRLDAADQVSPYFWSEWRDHVKSINPDALIIGEVWARPDPYLGGDQFDGVTNYQWAMASVDFFFDRKKPTKPSEFAQTLAELRISVPDEANYVVWNMIDSHDTDRALSMAKNPDRDYDRLNEMQGDGVDYDESKPGPDARQRLRLWWAFQMTYVGAPLVYYGTEVGMWGADDPNNRRPMVWEDLGPYEDDGVEVDQTLLDAFQRLVAIRNTWNCFRRGDFELLLADDRNEVLAYARQGEAEAAVVVINRSDKEQDVTLKVGTLRDAHGPVRRWTDVLREIDYTIFNSPSPTGQGMRRFIRMNRSYPVETRSDGTIQVKVGPMSAAIYVSGQGR